MAEFDQTGYSETVQRRPEYIEAREKALLDAIMGTQGSDGFTGGLIQETDDEGFRKYFNIAPYAMARQQGRDDEGNITGFGS